MFSKYLFFLMCLLFIITCASAEGTLAGTVIKNQASATYKDASNNSLSSTSNEVITTVQPKYEFTVTPNGSIAVPGQSQNATVGNTVYYPYKLLNSSNIDETFQMLPLIVNVGADPGTTFTPSNRKVYRDINGNGIVDAGDTEIAENAIFGPVAPDTYSYFIVAYDVPSGTAADKVAYVSPEVKSVHGTTLPTDADNMNKTTVVAGPVLTLNITATPTTVKPTDTVSYTVSGSNTGTAEALKVSGLSIGGETKDGIIISNQLPDDVVYKKGNYSGSPFDSQVVWSENGVDWLTTEPADATEVKYVGLYIPNVIPVGQAYELKYDVTVKPGTPAKIIPDDATIRYNDGEVNKTVTSNEVQVEVVPTIDPDVVLGPKSDPTSIGFIPDENLIAKAAAGSTVTFYNAVRNTGNVQDTFDLTYNPADFPANSIVLFYDVDGVTRLGDSDNDTIPDTGLVDPGATRQFIVKVILSGKAKNDEDDGAPHNLIVTATSSADPAESDPVTNQLTIITRPAVDIGNPDPDSGEVDDESKSFEIPPGSYTDIPLDILNGNEKTDPTGGQYPDTFTLSTSNLPADYVVTYYLDKNNNGVLDADELIPISNVSLPAWSGTGPRPEVKVIARVTIPEDAPPLTTNVGFVATSSLDPTVSDTIINEIEVPTVVGVTFEPDRNGTGIPGGTVTYTHFITNTGNAADVFDLTYTSSGSWNYVFYDESGNQITNIALAAGESKVVIVKGFIPTNAPVNTVDTFIGTAKKANTNVFDIVTDNTVVVAGYIQLNKKARNVTQGGSADTYTEGQPGNTMEYSIDYRNLSTVSVKELIVIDAVPQYTTFVSMATTMTGPGNKPIVFEWSTNGLNYTDYETTPPGDPATVKFVRWRFYDSSEPDDEKKYYDIPAGFDSSSTSKTLTFRVTIK